MSIMLHLCEQMFPQQIHSNQLAVAECDTNVCYSLRPSQGRDDGDNTPHAALWLRQWHHGACTGTRHREATCWQLAPAGPGDYLGRASGQGSQTLVPILPFSFSSTSVFTAFSSQLLGPQKLLTPRLHSSPALELLALRVLCEQKAPAVLNSGNNPLQTNSANVCIFSKTAYSVSKLNAIFYYSIGPP